MAQTDPYGGDVKGIGGWLIWPFGSLIITAVVLFGRLLVALRDWAQTAHAAVVFATDLALLGYVVFCFVRFLQERRNVPRLMSILYGVNAAFLIIFWIAYAGGYGWAVAHPVHFYPLPLLLPLTFALVWIAYFQASVRVKNTFVESAPRREKTVERPPRPESAGLGGWLLLPVGALALLAAAMLYGIVAQNLPAKMAFAVSHGHWPAFARQITGLGFTGLVLVALASVFRRKRYARWLILAAFGGVAALAVASIIQRDPNWHGAAIVGTLCLAAGVYMAVSKRVKNTFVR